MSFVSVLKPKVLSVRLGLVQSLLNSYLLNAKQKIGVVAIYDNALRLYITFISKDFIISIQLTDSPILGNLEIEVIFLAIHRGWPELCFY